METDNDATPQWTEFIVKTVATTEHEFTLGPNMRFIEDLRHAVYLKLRIPERLQ